MKYTFQGKESLERDAAVLAQAFNVHGSPIDHQTSLNVLARLAGFASYGDLEATTNLWCNRFQRAALLAYERGEFAYLADCASEADFWEGLASCGDGLLGFMLSELATDQGCDSPDEAIRRVQTCTRQLYDVVNALEEVEDGDLGLVGVAEPVA